MAAYSWATWAFGVLAIHQGYAALLNSSSTTFGYTPKDWEVHESMTYFTLYSYNFCWPVRTLQEKKKQGGWQQRSPAMAAKLTDHVWKWEEWFTFPAAQLP
jgi:hypothetical protein